MEIFVDCCKVDLVTRFFIHNYISIEPFLCYEKRVVALSYSWNTLWILDYSKQMNLLYMKAHFGWTKMIQFCKKCKNNNKMFLGCFPTAFIDDPSLKKLNASRKGLRAHVVMIHRRSVQRSLHLQRNTYNHTNIKKYTLKKTLNQNSWCGDDPLAKCTKEFGSPKRHIQPHKHMNFKIKFSKILNLVRLSDDPCHRYIKELKSRCVPMFWQTKNIYIRLCVSKTCAFSQKRSFSSWNIYPSPEIFTQIQFFDKVHVWKEVESQKVYVCVWNSQWNTNIQYMCF